MFWSDALLGGLMVLTGLVFLLCRKRVVSFYTSRRIVLPPEHPQYRAEPAFTTTVSAFIGMFGIIAGVAVLML